MTLDRTLLWLTLAAASCSRSDPTAVPPPSTAAPTTPTAPTAPASSTPAHNDPAAARALIQKGAIVIDVRTPDEYADGHLPRAVNVPVMELPARISEVAKLVSGDKTKPIVVYCAAGSRAAKAKRFLEGAGYSQVVNGGGFDDLNDDHAR